MNYNDNGTIKQITVKAGDTLPVGTEVDVPDGTTIPAGWEQVNNPDSYSTNEVKTNKTWINGKPIYRKVIDFGALPNNTSKSVNHNINNLDLVVNIRGVSKNPTSGSIVTIPDHISSNIVGIYVDNTVIGVNTNNSAWVNNITYIILEYTKTTD